MTPPFLTQTELAARWRISPRTLERWRWAGDGLRFTKVGGRVLYSLADVEAYEAAQSRTITGNVSTILPEPVLAPKRGEIRKPLAPAFAGARSESKQPNGRSRRR